MIKADSLRALGKLALEAFEQGDSEQFIHQLATGQILVDLTPDEQKLVDALADGMTPRDRLN